METTDLLVWMVAGITALAIVLSGVLLVKIYGTAHQ